MHFKLLTAFAFSDKYITMQMFSAAAYEMAPFRTDSFLNMEDYLDLLEGMDGVTVV